MTGILIARVVEVDGVQFMSYEQTLEQFQKEWQEIIKGLKKVKKMTKVIIRTDKVEGFFDRARKAAQKADRDESFKKSATFSFEDPKEMFMVLSEAH